jgi:hypothetical protein
MFQELEENRGALVRLCILFEKMINTSVLYALYTLANTCQMEVWLCFHDMNGNACFDLLSCVCLRLDCLCTMA